jgi:hypothetical protein
MAPGFERFALLGGEARSLTPTGEGLGMAADNFRFAWCVAKLRAKPRT